MDLIRIKVSIFLAVLLQLISLWVPAQDRQFSSSLPLVFIDTDGAAIPDDPKILVDMGIVWNGPGKINQTSGNFNHYNGKIGIELRGSSSQTFAKKSYGFETRDADGEDMDFSVLGLPPEEDWIFYGPYSDKSLIRNVLIFTLAKSLGSYSSRCRFVELFLNGTYQGVYVLMEKIKREDIRVDIATLNPDETDGEDLTGGYIIKIDKTTGSGGQGWHSRFQEGNGTYTYWQYEVPDQDEIVPEQETYIQDYVDQFEEAVYYKHFEGEGSYLDYMEPLSFVDYILVSELTKNVDAYRLSTFFFKDKNGKLNAGPIWDYNLGFGNCDYESAWRESGFVIDEMQTFHPAFWSGLLADTTFTNYMRCRWESLRRDHWSREQVMGVVDSLVTTLGPAIDRNFERWPVLGEKLWPNYYVGETYEDEITWLKDWIGERLTWVDNHLPGTCREGTPPPGGANDEDISGNAVATFFPNPFNDEIRMKMNPSGLSDFRLQLFNLSGSLVWSGQFSAAGGEQTFSFNAESLSGGVYLYVLSKEGVAVQLGKLTKGRW